jgi:patatin-like phospholipase/acyl hydrolase
MEDITMDLSPVPRRLLSIDGGGLLGLIPAEALVAIETQLNTITGKEAPLCDRFHLIGGTSTGAILAAGLSLGLKAAQLRDFYLNFGKEIFTKVFLPERIWHSYPSGPLEHQLKDVFGEDTNLGSGKLRTNILIVSKNVTLGTTWFFTNNPKGRYFANNAELPLWQIVRASTAARRTFRRSPSRFPTTTASSRTTSSSMAALAATTIHRCRFFWKPLTRDTSSDGPPVSTSSCSSRSEPGSRPSPFLKARLRTTTCSTGLDT